MDFDGRMKAFASRVEDGIDRLLPAADARPARLHAAMRYAMQPGGKRLRPVLVLAAAELFDAAKADPLPCAVAVECLHAYSLVHDDLPCMDDDDLRRGRPTVHKAFDEATALLAGDALLTHAFSLLATGYADRPALAQALSAELADAAGSRRLIGGQMADLLAEERPDTGADEVRYIHLNKTAAMIEAALVMGGRCGGAGDDAIAALREAGRHLGLAFQIVDDLLDATADTATLGKTAGKDARAGKATSVKVDGIDGARRKAAEQSAAAVAAFGRLPGGAGFLAALAEGLADRAR
jgi:geranylgeranyl pyrophosphate synthase